MRLFSLLALIGAMASGAMACGEHQSERCRDVCQKENECAEQRKNVGEALPYDLDECVAACVALERDLAGKELVDKHVKCANEAGDSCEALWLCR